MTRQDWFAGSLRRGLGAAIGSIALAAFSSGALADKHLNPVEQAYVDEIREERPDQADRIDARLKKIDGTQGDRGTKDNLKKKYIETRIKALEKDLRLAEQFGNKKQAKRINEILAMLRQWRVRERLDAKLRKADSQSATGQQQDEPGSAGAHRFDNFTIGGFYGSYGYSDFTGDNGFSVDVHRYVVGAKYNFPITEGFRGIFTGEFTQDNARFRGDLITDSTAWATGIAYYHNGEGSSVGVEGGLRFHSDGNGGQTMFKLGGLGRVRIGDLFAFDAYGGALVPTIDENILDTSFYAGGELSGYFSDDLAVSGFMDWSKARWAGPGDRKFHSLQSGVRLTYLCPTFEGVRLWGSASYGTGWFEDNGSTFFEYDGPEVKIGVSLDLFSNGAQPNSLIRYDDHIFNTSVFALSREF